MRIWQKKFLLNFQVPAKTEIAKLLKDEGFISDYSVVKINGNKSTLVIDLKFTVTEKPVIQGLQKRKPSCRKYVNGEEVPRFLEVLV